MEILGLLSLPGWFVGVITFVISICLYSWYKQNFYTRLGIRQKKTTLCLGDIPIMFKKGFNYIDVDMVKENGKCFGLYLGNTPSLVVSDADMLKEIMVKQFPKFINREIVIPLEKIWYKSVNNAFDEHWRFLRNTISPAFSSGKLKQMAHYIQKCQNNLLDILDEKQSCQDDGFDIVPVIRGYTMDVICSTGFGVDVNSQRDPDNPFIKYAKEFFEIDVGKNPIFLLAFLFPEIRHFLDRMEVPLVTKECFEFFKKTTETLSEDRRKVTSKHKDLLQQLISAQTVNSQELDDTKGELTHDDCKRRGLTDEEILVNSTVFMTAGYDTTAVSLSWLAYELGLHPEIQERLINEIDEKVGKETPTYDSAFKLEYLDMVVSEILRLHPPAGRVNRQAVEDTDVCGVPIKKGMTISIPIIVIHHLPEYWPQPETFDPERFSPENRDQVNQYAYLPFGNGPRNCIGQRLALLELKMTVIALLQKFKVVRSPKLQVPMPVSKLGMAKPAHPVYVTLEKR